MDRLRIAPLFVDAFRALGLDSAAAVVRALGGVGPFADTTEVRRTELRLPGGETRSVFFKTYDYTSPSWRFIGRRSKAWCEFDNYGALAALGIPTLERVACGEERDRLGRLRRAFMVTVELPRAATLREFTARVCPDRRDAGRRALRDDLVAQLAATTRRAHAAGFFHSDLFWRNLLVTREASGQARLWWIDCPRGGFDRWSPWRRHRRIKDLASLAVSTPRSVERSERLEFFKRYLAIERLDQESRRLARDVEAYRTRRWRTEQV